MLDFLREFRAESVKTLELLSLFFWSKSLWLRALYNTADWTILFGNSLKEESRVFLILHLPSSFLSRGSFTFLSRTCQSITCFSGFLANLWIYSSSLALFIDLSYTLFTGLAPKLSFVFTWDVIHIKWPHSSKRNYQIKLKISLMCIKLLGYINVIINTK